MGILAPAAAAWDGWVGTIESNSTSVQIYGAYESGWIRSSVIALSEPGSRTDSSRGTGTGKEDAFEIYHDAEICGQRWKSSVLAEGAIVDPAIPTGELPIEIAVVAGPSGYTIQALRGGSIWGRGTTQALCFDPSSSENWYPAYFRGIHVPYTALTDLTRIQYQSPSIDTVCGPGCTERESIKLNLVRTSATIEVVKELVPTEDNGRFDLLIDGITRFQGAKDGDSTGQIGVLPGTHSVSEGSALDRNGQATALANYTTTISCIDVNRPSEPVAAGSGTSLSNIVVGLGDTIKCTIRNRHVEHVADIRGAVQAAQSTVSVGSTVQVVHTMTNDGPDAAEGAQMNLQHDPRLQVVSVTQGGGGTCASTVLCTVPSLPSGSSFTATVTYRANQSGDDMVSANSVGSATRDPDLSDNSAQTTFDVSALTLTLRGGYTFTGLMGAGLTSVRGQDRVSVVGSPEALAEVREVCIRGTWFMSALDTVRGSDPAFWNRDNFPFDPTQSPGVEPGGHTASGGFGSSYTERTFFQPPCFRGYSAAWRGWPTQNRLNIVFGGLMREIEHDLTVWVNFNNGRPPCVLELDDEDDHARRPGVPTGVLLQDSDQKVCTI
jgi:hypothetical protein